MFSWRLTAAFAAAIIATVYCVLPEQYDECVRGCPSGFFYFDDSCYVIPRIKVSWGQAVGYCRALDSELLTIETASEQSFLAKELKKHHGKTFWFSATDIVVEDQWRMGVKMSTILVQNWAPGQPDNNATAETEGEHCAIIDTHGSWFDEDCKHKHYFICEKPSV